LGIVIMRTRLTAAVLSATLLVPAVVVGIASADPGNRTGGSITTPEDPAPANGGDQGWGNCGHNSSGGAAHTGDNGNGNGNGNGGDNKADCVTTVPNADDGGGQPTT
jgi:hypothetical protein